MTLSKSGAEAMLADLFGAAPEPPRGRLLTEVELANLLGVGTSRIRTLSAEGVLPKAAPARWDRDASVRAYCADLRAKLLAKPRKAENPELDAEKLTLLREQRTKLELANAKQRGELLPAGVVEHQWSAILGSVRAAMLAVPSRVGQRLPHLSTHDLAALDREIREALTEASGGNPDDL